MADYGSSPRHMARLGRQACKMRYPKDGRRYCQSVAYHCRIAVFIGHGMHRWLGRNRYGYQYNFFVFRNASCFAIVASWLCSHCAMQNGIVHVVVLIDELRILVTATFCYFVCKSHTAPQGALQLGVDGSRNFRTGNMGVNWEAIV